ncbi:uncharacterized protein LY79DRAFT_47159 [Colletotrichum navitas]|uniref:Uncharacterized protein n=1 Tax=Colletotrichum navitas TaxID=681940 RepID=A0AAD8Q5Y1_9PEZI|nr:uncharacterized protein LY79DRAFT_47159 [Colletotrichum navitas]KAK1596513.1 hypothetical protein LY79DRAFT_47159 [Colletotrichum navitas]
MSHILPALCLSTLCLLDQLDYKSENCNLSSNLIPELAFCHKGRSRSCTIKCPAYGLRHLSLKNKCEDPDLTVNIQCCAKNSKTHWLVMWAMTLNIETLRLFTRSYVILGLPNLVVDRQP